MRPAITVAGQDACLQMLTILSPVMAISTIVLFISIFAETRLDIRILGLLCIDRMLKHVYALFTALSLLQPISITHVISNVS